MAYNTDSRTQKTQHHILIVGAGWAGLRCAYTLSTQGYKVTLLEAGATCGGRARSFRYEGLTLDTGQHIALGAYTELRRLLTELGIQESACFHRLPLDISFYQSDCSHPLHFQWPSQRRVWSLLQTSWQTTLPLTDKLRLGHYLQQRPRLFKDMPVLDHLLEHHQSFRVIKTFWEPFVLATLATPIATASMSIFHQILKESLWGPSGACDLLLPKVSLSELLPNKICHYLNSHGARIHTSTLATSLIGDRQITGVQTRRGVFTADHIILATPPDVTSRLLTHTPKLKSLANTLQKIPYQPIITVYIVFDKPINLPKPMIGLLNHVGHWIFDHRVTQQPHLLSVVISSQSVAETLDNPTLLQTLMQELRFYFPLPEVLDYKVIRSHKAAFSCDVQTQQLRPQVYTALPNLWLTGDYVANTYPATLEGALCNGLRTAHSVTTSAYGLTAV